MPSHVELAAVPGRPSNAVRSTIGPSGESAGVSGVTMKATPTKVRNRHATVFTGRLLGGPVPRRGVVIDLQVFFRKHWRTFAAPRTNRRGVYRFKYRFMAGAATWRFRARVRRDSSYPFELGTSARPVRVRVL